MYEDSDYKSVTLYNRAARKLFYDCDPLLQVPREENLLDDPHIVDVEEPEDTELSPSAQYRRMLNTTIQETLRKAIARGSSTSENANAQLPVLQEVRERARHLTLEEALKEATVTKFLYASRAIFEKLADQETIQDSIPRFAEYKGIDLIENEYLNDDELFFLDMKDFKLAQSLIDFSRKNEVVRFVWRGKLECMAPENQALVTI